jgi:hypothetical protein
MIPIEQRRYICIIDYKQFNKPTSNVKVYRLDTQALVRLEIEKEFNSDGKSLINIRSIRLLNDD